MTPPRQLGVGPAHEPGPVVGRAAPDLRRPPRASSAARSRRSSSACTRTCARPSAPRIQAAIAEGRPFAFEERVLQARRQRAHAVRRAGWSSRPPPAGRPVRVAGACLDITDAREAAAQLEDSKRAAVRDLSTPILQVRAGLLILPVVGALDGERRERLAAPQRACSRSCIRATRARARSSSDLTERARRSMPTVAHPARCTRWIGTPDGRPRGDRQARADHPRSSQPRPPVTRRDRRSSAVRPRPRLVRTSRSCERSSRGPHHASVRASPSGPPRPQPMRTEPARGSSPARPCRG